MSIWFMYTHTHTPQSRYVLPVTYYCQCALTHFISFIPHTLTDTYIYTLIFFLTRIDVFAGSCLFISGNTLAGVGDPQIISRLGTGRGRVGSRRLWLCAYLPTQSSCTEVKSFFGVGVGEIFNILGQLHTLDLGDFQATPQFLS